MNAETKSCANCSNSFTIEPADFNFYDRMKVPPPTWCPSCRFQRRLSLSVGRALYKRICDLCGQSTMSSYPPDRSLIVYCPKCWWSDKWDGDEYSKEYDSSRPFLEQLKELIWKTPNIALQSEHSSLLNSPYINHSATSKNCYLIFVADECENVLYSEYLLHDKDLMDCTMTGGSELCYELINSGPCYKTFYSEDCENCQDVYFSKDLNGCSHCFGCVGLRNKSFHIWNQSFSKEEYNQILEDFNLASYKKIEEFREKAISFWQKYPHKYAHALRNVNVTGDYVYSSKNCRQMYVVHEGAENSNYCQLMTMSGIKDSYDCTLWGNAMEKSYENMVIGQGVSDIKFSCQIWPNSHDVEYSYYVMSSSNIFGCANTRNKQYCILNKKYSEKEYAELKNRIIQDMKENPYKDKAGRTYPYGEFLPTDLSLVGYNESYAYEYFPLAKNEADESGLPWYEPQPLPYKATIASSSLPDTIQDVPDSILQEIIECEFCAKAFRIIPAELDLLRRFNLPVPRRCVNCRYRRHRDRITPPFLYHRKCQCNGRESNNGLYQNTSKNHHSHQENNQCPNEFETSYAPDRPEIVYCETCYQNEVV